MNWSGDVVRQARAYMASQPLPWTCGQCKEEIRQGQPWVVGHIKPRAIYPELTLDITNWQHEHRLCSDRSGHAVKQQKAIYSQGKAIQSPPPFLNPSLATSEDFVPSNMTWDYFVEHAPTWLNDILEVPEDSSPPLAMTPVHKEAVGTYGPMADKWIQEELNIDLRWWQRLALYRQLEHRADGSLCWEFIVESAPRRSGKSVRLTCTVLWRMAHADLLGERQEVIHTANNMRIAKKIQEGWYRWAEAKDWTVRRSNGSEEIADPYDNKWLLLPGSAITGFSPGFIVADECWDIKPIVISENAEPALMDRHSPQLLLTSTAHTKATSLMRKRIGEALGKNPDPDTLLLLWGAKPTDDVHDREIWTRASPHQTAPRRKTMERKYRSAIAGEADPEFDDMEPMEGFKAQYLNIWPLSDMHVSKGQPLINEEAWDALKTSQPVEAPKAAAVEMSFSGGLSVALAWPSAVKVEQVDDTEAVDAVLRASGFTGVVQVGKSLQGAPALSTWRLEACAQPVTAAVQEFSHLLNESAVHWIGSDLTEQVLNVRLETKASGIRMLSNDRTDGIKAAVWAIKKARTKQPSGMSFIY